MMSKLPTHVPPADRAAQRLAAIASKPAAAATGLAPSGIVGASLRKREPRTPVFRQARLNIAGGGAVQCVVVDISENGARIHLEGASGLPDMVTLTVLATGAVRRGRVVWRSDSAAGLSFRIETGRSFGARNT
jgi:hypothetical protein